MGFVSLTAGLMPCGSSSWPVWAGIGPQVNLRPCHPSMPSTVRRCSAFTCSCHEALFACSAARPSRRSLNLNRSQLREKERMNERSPPNPNARARIRDDVLARVGPKLSKGELQTGAYAKMRRKIDSCDMRVVPTQLLDFCGPN